MDSELPSFLEFSQLNREIGTSRGHWGDGEFAAVRVNRGWAGTASRWTDNPSEARWRRQLLTTLAHNRYLVEAPG